MDFGRQLRLLRTARGLTQRELAKRTGIGIGHAMISQMETGKLLPGPEWLAALREALDWPAEMDGELEAVLGEETVPG